MDFSGQYRFIETAEFIRSVITKPENLEKCLKGCKWLEVVSDNQIKSLVHVHIGSLEAEFYGEILLSDAKEQQNTYTVSSTWKSGYAGCANLLLNIQLSEQEEETLISYEVKLELKGELSCLETKSIEEWVKSFVDDFFNCLTKQLHYERQTDLIMESNVENAVLHVEEAVELEAGKGTLGGPRIWLLIVLALFLALLWLFNSQVSDSLF